MKTFLLELKASVLLTAVFVVLLCGAYPLAVWIGAQTLFPARANGSLVVDKDAANTTIETATYVQYGAVNRPTVPTVTDKVTYERHMSPAEGTA